MNLSRRTVLKGAGAAVALPFLESLAPAAPAKPPLRLAIYTVTGGTVLESWKPKETGAFGKLPSILRSLEPHKNDFLMLSGLSHRGKAQDLNGHEHAGYLHLTGAPAAGKRDGKPYAGISVDQAAAKLAGGSTWLPSLEVGNAHHETRYSWRGPEEFVPYETEPKLVFERLFKGRPAVVPNWARRAARPPAADPPKSDAPDQKVVDAVLDEARALRAKLGKADAARLEEYLSGVESVERRVRRHGELLRLEALDAKSPGPSALAMPPENDPGWTARRNMERDPDRMREFMRLMADLAVLALQTDSTRVASLALGSDETQFHGVVTVGYERHCHTLEHQGNSDRPENADPIAREACRQMHEWYTRLFGETLAKMKSIDEGGSTLLDNTLLVYTSYMADGGHSRDDYPILLAGRGQGTLKPGRHLAFPKKTPVSNLYAELLKRLGAPELRFGESTGGLEGLA